MADILAKSRISENNMDTSLFKINKIFTKLKDSDSEIIIFNVSGNIIATTKSIITKKIKKEGSDEFYNPHLLEELYYKSLENETDIIHIERNPICFNLILNYLKSPEDKFLISENDFFYKKLLDEA